MPPDMTAARGAYYFGKPSKTDDDTLKSLKVLFQYGRANRDPNSANFNVSLHRGSTQRGQKSGFFSASDDFPVAANFGFGHGINGLVGADTPGLVLVIDGKNAPGLDLVSFYQYAKRHAPTGADIGNGYQLETEFAFTGIDPRQIRGAWIRRVSTVGKNPVPLEFIPNPNYDPDWLYPGN
jgi:hypothetical protein